MAKKSKAVALVEANIDQLKKLLAQLKAMQARKSNGKHG